MNDLAFQNFVCIIMPLLGCVCCWTSVGGWGLSVLVFAVVLLERAKATRRSDRSPRREGRNAAKCQYLEQQPWTLTHSYPTFPREYLLLFAAGGPPKNTLEQQAETSRGPHARGLWGPSRDGYGPVFGLDGLAGLLNSRTATGWPSQSDSTAKEERAEHGKNGHD